MTTIKYTIFGFYKNHKWDQTLLLGTSWALKTLSTDPIFNFERYFFLQNNVKHDSENDVKNDIEKRRLKMT